MALLWLLVGCWVRTVSGSRCSSASRSSWAMPAWRWRALSLFECFCLSSCRLNILFVFGLNLLDSGKCCWPCTFILFCRLGCSCWGRLQWIGVGSSGASASRFWFVSRLKLHTPEVAQTFYDSVTFVLIAKVPDMAVARHGSQ